ncbi:MAG: hypothetical protein Q8N23_32490 [Archangium sp.]|nr:hypothetical protein [Archangium sp.]MDP3157432.1 hypothetical protein [Archangium sp.]MDP3572182.1 hypothetical protein [Archangium sp.]
MKNTTKGLILLSAVASLSAFAADKPVKAKDAKEVAQVSCEGVNECKGKGACGNASHDCAGMNECKGKGWISLSAADCKTKGGKVAAAAKKM